MGVSVDAQKNSESAYVKSIEILSQIVALRMQVPIFGTDFIFNLSPYKSKMDKALKIVHGQSEKVIEARRQELEKMNMTSLKDSSELGS
ncbi:hypothetical protein O3G_MSEX014821 [Manduca sexta]|uniref:Uncharacterized protein n=1 Tax=Manduca sexta TaxID=7130 RepID=A0A922D0X4_MANSE|nr:hypothetical protein O3G_MSEX014821 [Manduca sexta]KAG6464932.1 hypothetical protein O3G_MSEX014821 [Manduca sexta]